MGKRSGVLLFCIGKTECRMELLFPVTVFLLCRYGGDGFTAALCLLASFWHECGHLTALAVLGCRPRMICLGGFGMRIVLPSCAITPYVAQTAIALAGPLASAVAAAICGGMGWTTAALVHATLCGLNLLPIQPLDGGQALRAWLCRAYMPEQADRALSIASTVTLLLLSGGALILFLQSGYNFSLLAMCLYLVFLIVLKNKD